MNQDPQSNEETQEDTVETSAEASSAATGGSASAASSSSAAGSFDEDTEAMLNEIEQLKAETAEAKEAVLRAQAEAQNTRRRAEMDVEKAHKFALEKFVSDMLPVADNLERALAAAGERNEQTEAFIEGVELTLKSLVDALKRHAVEQINPVNEPFDPQLHQAMTAVENGELEPNTVLDVFQCGYTLNGRLVRPAMVVVSKAPADA